MAATTMTVKPDACGRGQRLLGQVVNGPYQVPGSSGIVRCLDPQGAAFAMVSQKS